jgi:hypothetical protein
MGAEPWPDQKSVQGTGAISFERDLFVTAFSSRECWPSKVSEYRGEVGSALTQFVEQPRVLDGDNSLSGEVCEQLNLPLGKQPDFLAINVDSSD